MSLRTRRGASPVVALLPMVGVPAAALTLLLLLQGASSIPPEAVSWFRLAVGIFGVPGAIVWTLLGIAVWQRIKNPPASASANEARIADVVRDILAEDRIQRTRDYDQFTERVSDSLTIAHSRLTTTLAAWSRTGPARGEN